MTDNSQNSELLEPKIQEKEEAIPQEGRAEQKKKLSKKSQLQNQEADLWASKTPSHELNECQ